MSSDSHCGNSGSFKVTQIADSDLYFTECDYLLSQDGPAIASITGTSWSTCMTIAQHTVQAVSVNEGLNYVKYLQTGTEPERTLPITSATMNIYFEVTARGR
jgi:hypothetical protein